jgi:acyl-coenzyme A synthetase/AMP-(fatty) acid ligase
VTGILQANGVSWAEAPVGFVPMWWIIFADEWLARPGSVGKPRQGSELVIMSDEGNILPPGQVGTMYSYNPGRGIFRYFEDEDKRTSLAAGTTPP